MPYFLLGLLLLIAAVLVTRALNAAPSGGRRGFGGRSARSQLALRRAMGTLAMVVAGLATSRGAIGLAVPAGAIGAYLLFGGAFGTAGRGGPSSGGSGRTSEVQTETLEMQLDIDSGAMRGRVRRGDFAGRDLETMTPAEVAALWQDCRFDDPPSAQLLEAYLDARHPSWREDADRAAGGNDGFSGNDGRSMSRAEALDVLGLDETAGAEDVRRAHRNLMQEHHPDRGGDTAMAAKLNEAKDKLLEDG